MLLMINKLQGFTKGVYVLHSELCNTYKTSNQASSSPLVRGIMILNEALAVWYASNDVYQTVVTVLVKNRFCITQCCL